MQRLPSSGYGLPPLLGAGMAGKSSKARLRDEWGGDLGGQGALEHPKESNWKLTF